MTPEDEEFNRVEMESRIKQEYIRSIHKKFNDDFGRKYAKLEHSPRTALRDEYERGFVDGMQEQLRRTVDKAVNRMPVYTKLMEELAIARTLIRELGDRLAKLEGKQ